MRGSSPLNVAYVGHVPWRIVPPRKADAPILAHHTTAVLALRRDGGTETRGVQWTDQAHPFAWPRLYERLHGRMPLWVFVFDLPTWATTASLWEQIDRGILRLAPYRASSRHPARPGRPAQPGAITLDSPPAFCFLHHPRGEIRFVDIRNYWPGDCESVLSTPEYQSTTAPDPERPDDTAIVAALAQARAVRVRMHGLFERWAESPGGNWKPTAPALAMASYRAWNDPAAPVPHGDDESKALERRGYYGGRQHVGWVGRIVEPDGPAPPNLGKARRGGMATRFGPVALLDVRGLYAAVMRDGVFPRKLIGRYKRLTAATLESILQVHGAIASVLIDTLDRPYPRRTGERTEYPLGVYWTTLAGAELSAAVSAGHVRGVGEVSVFSLGQPFKGWCEHWIGTRQSADAAGDLVTSALAKLVLNSLYGRFAMRSPRWDWCPGAWCVEPWGNWIAAAGPNRPRASYRAVGSEVFVANGSSERRGSFPAVSAFVAAAAREHMRRIFGVIPDCDLLYSHTDSVLTTESGHAALVAAGWVAPGEYGRLQPAAWHLEGVIHGPGDVELGADTVLSGLPRAAKRSGKRKWKGEHWPSLSTILSERPAGVVKIAPAEFAPADIHAPGRIDEAGYVHPRIRTLDDPD